MLWRGRRHSGFHPATRPWRSIHPKDQYKGSQVHFYAVDLKKENVNLLEGEDAGLRKLDIEDAEMHGTLKHLASVFSIGK